MEDRVREAADTLMDAIKESDVYRHYQELAVQLQSNPEVFDEILKLRAQTIDAYHGEESGDLLERSDELAERYDVLLRNAKVNEFLETEEELIRMLQGIYRGFLSGVVLYLPRA